MVSCSVTHRFQRTALRAVAMIKKGDRIPSGEFKFVPNTPSLRDISIVRRPHHCTASSERQTCSAEYPRSSLPTTGNRKGLSSSESREVRSTLPARCPTAHRFTTAFTSTCSVQHLPPFVKLHDQLKAKGIDSINCVAANDVFVQSAWGRISNVEEKVIMLSDSKLDWLEAAGLTQDCSFNLLPSSPLSF